MEATPQQERWTAGHDEGSTSGRAALRRARYLHGLNHDLAADWLAGASAGFSSVIRTAIRDSTSPGADLSADDVDVLIATAATLWDPDGDGADEALSERQREVLAKARDIYRREYDQYGDDRNWDWQYGDDPAVQDGDRS